MSTTYQKAVIEWQKVIDEIQSGKNTGLRVGGAGILTLQAFMEMVNTNTIIHISTQSELDSFKAESAFAIVTMTTDIDQDIRDIFGNDFNKIEIHSYTIAGTTTSAGDLYQEGVSAIDGKSYRRFYNAITGWTDFSVVNDTSRKVDFIDWESDLSENYSVIKGQIVRMNGTGGDATSEYWYIVLQDYTGTKTAINPLNSPSYYFDITGHTHSWASITSKPIVSSFSNPTLNSNIPSEKLVKDNLDLKEDKSNKGQNNGYAGLDSTGKLEQNIDASKITTGTIDINRIPKTAIERLIVVADQTARYALTINEVQNGDTVKQNDTNTMYFVIDDTNLSNANGYQVYTAGIAGAVEWNNVLNKPSSFTPSSHNHLNDTLKPNVVEYQSGATVPTNVGSTYYDDTYKVLSTVLGNGVVLQNGLEMYVRVVNKTGVQLNDGQVVYISGAQGNRPTATLAIATSELASYVIGVCTENIANNQEGFVTVFGTVNGYNTSSFTDGAKLYLSATVAGELTTTRPVAPNHGVIVGIALNSTNNGAIFVNPNSGFELSELHDVDTTKTKTAPLDADYILLQDTADNNIWKKVTKLNTDEVHIGATAPLNNQKLWVDTSTQSSSTYSSKSKFTIDSSTSGTINIAINETRYLSTTLTNSHTITITPLKPVSVSETLVSSIIFKVGASAPSITITPDSGVTHTWMNTAPSSFTINKANEITFVWISTTECLVYSKEQS